MEKYEEMQDIASGNFGVVRLMRHRKSRELVAVKFIERGEKIDKNVAGEVANHLQLRHPNVIQLKEVMLTQTHLALVLEYAAGGELFDQICDRGPFSENKARFFFQQLISGVSYFHQKHICHRDLKLENVLLDDSPSPRLKICDFGYSKSGILHSRPKSAVGTPAYVAPEVLSRKEYDGKLADIWSCGVILYVMLVGTYPFEDERDPTNIKSTVQRIKAVQYKVPDHIRISADCKQFISRIFVRDPSKRITTKEIKSHPWFLKDLPRELTDSAQSVYERDNTFLDPSTKKILKIVEEARTKPKSSSFKEKAEADEPKEEESEDLELDMDLLRI